MAYTSIRIDVTETVSVSHGSNVTTKHGTRCFITTYKGYYDQLKIFLRWDFFDAMWRDDGNSYGDTVSVKINNTRCNNTGLATKFCDANA